MPKHSAVPDELEAALKIYYNTGCWMNNKEYKQQLKEIIGADQYPSSYTKKNQIIAYFGFTEWEDISRRQSKRRITVSGQKMYYYIKKNDKAGIQEIIMNALETVPFGKNNYGCPDSNSIIDPPCLCVRAILDLDYITYKEFAYLLWNIADLEREYESIIDEIRQSRMGNIVLELNQEAKKYRDAKPVEILLKWGFFRNISLSRTIYFTITPEVHANYARRLRDLSIYNTAKSVYNAEFEINISSLDTAFANESCDEIDQFLTETVANAEVLGIGSQELTLLNARTPEVLDTKTGRKYKTDPRIIKTALSQAQYKCKIDATHCTFPVKDMHDYSEGHHLIPMKAQKDFTVNLDRTENIVSLCPTCHKAIHYSSKAYKRRLLGGLFTEEKRQELNALGINITLKELLDRYY